MFLSEHKRQMMLVKYEISPECGELRAKILSRILQNCVFSPPSKSFLRLSALSVWLPHYKQTEFFEFGERNNLQNDLVGVEPVASIRRLTAVCVTREVRGTCDTIWSNLKPLPTKHMSIIFRAWIFNVIQIYSSRPRSRLRRSLGRFATSFACTVASRPRPLSLPSKSACYHSLSFTRGRLGASLPFIELDVLNEGRVSVYWKLITPSQRNVSTWKAVSQWNNRTPSVHSFAAKR